MQCQVERQMLPTHTATVCTPFQDTEYSIFTVKTFYFKIMKTIIFFKEIMGD